MSITVFLLANVNSHLWGVAAVSSEWGTIKYSSIKSGVFPIALTSPVWGVEGVSYILYPNYGPVHEQTPMDNCCHPCG